jgi:hypothetical protein
MVETFVDTQLQIIERETLLFKYDCTQRQSLIILENAGGVNNRLYSSPSKKSLIVQQQGNFRDTSKKTYQELQDSYNQDRLALIMQGLSVTGSLLPSTFSIPTDLNCESTGRQKSKLIPKLLAKRDKLTFTAYRYPKTIDIHSLRSIAIRLLVDLCPYKN